jgi:glycosyltransferase involved in cell wall biosynthesis
MPAKRALVLSYSPIARDPRVQRQIQWLKFREFEVDVCGLGAAPRVGESAYHEILVPSLGVRLRHYLFSNARKRETTFISSKIVSLIQDDRGNEAYALAVMNDLDFLGSDSLFEMLKANDTQIALDLHEYFFDVGGSFAWRLLHGRYYKWLLKKLETRMFSQVFTVSEAIAKLYESTLGVPLVALENSPDIKRTSSLMAKSGKLGKNQNVRLIHHGNLGKGRGIVRLIRAMRLVDTRFELHLMLIMSPWSKLLVKALVSILGLEKRVFLVDPVPMSDILRKLSSFDVEVIFYHPPHSTNELYSLPNKFFESLASGLAIVVGPSPSMAEIVTEHEIGVVAQAWSKESLAEAINALTPTAINLAKGRTSSTLARYDAAKAKEKFCNALNI